MHIDRNDPTLRALMLEYYNQAFNDGVETAAKALELVAVSAPKQRARLVTIIRTLKLETKKPEKS